MFRRGGLKVLVVAWVFGAGRWPRVGHGLGASLMSWHGGLEVLVVVVVRSLAGDLGNVGALGLPRWPVRCAWAYCVRVLEDGLLSGLGGEPGRSAFEGEYLEPPHSVRKKNW